MAKLLQELAQLGAELVVAVGDRDHPVDGEAKLFFVRVERLQIRLVHCLSAVGSVRRRKQLEGDQVASIRKPQREVGADDARRESSRASGRKTEVEEPLGS